MIGVLCLLMIAMLTAPATGLVAVGFGERRIGANEPPHVQALFNPDAGAEGAKMRLSHPARRSTSYPPPRISMSRTS